MIDKDDVNPEAFEDMIGTVVNIVGGDVVRSTATDGPRSDHYVVNIKRCTFGKLEIGLTVRASASTGMGSCGPRLYIKGIAWNAWEDAITRRLMTVLKERFNKGWRA